MSDNLADDHPVNSLADVADELTLRLHNKLAASHMSDMAPGQSNLNSKHTISMSVHRHLSIGLAKKLYWLDMHQPAYLQMH